MPAIKSSAFSCCAILITLIVTDLINELVKILRLETEELQDAARQMFKPVKP